MNPPIRYAVCELSLQRYIDPRTATGRRILQRRTAADSAANPCRIAIGFLMLMLAVLTDCAFARGDEMTDKAVDHGIIFETNPPYLRYCGTPVEKTAIRINWDVSALGVDHISIRLDDREGRVVARGRATGETETGEWVRDGRRFVLVDARNDELLAEKIFRILPCDTAQYPDS